MGDHLQDKPTRAAIKDNGCVRHAPHKKEANNKHTKALTGEKFELGHTANSRGMRPHWDSKEGLYESLPFTF